jgi:two-component system CheB/CheR fusion protein
MNLSLDYFEDFFNGTPAGIAIMTSRIINFANSQLADITGYGKKELTGKYGGIFYPNERESKKIEKSFYPLLRKNGLATIETRWRTRSGKTVDVFLGGILLDYKMSLEKSDLEKETILMMVFDISERKSVESDLRRNKITPAEALEQAGDGFWEWNIETGEVQFNDAWIKMLGYKKKEIDPHIRSWQSLIHPDDWHRVRKALNDHLWGDAESYSTEYRIKASSGKWLWLFDYGEVVENDEYQYPYKFFGTSTEITYLKKSEQKVFATENQVKALSQAETSLTPRLFRKKTIPAKGMEGFFRLLQNPYINSDQREQYLGQMLNSGSRIHEFVHNLLNVSRLNSDQLNVQSEEFNVNIMLNGLYGMYSQLARNKGIHLQLYTPYRDDRSFVMTDERKLQQILRYLLDNALFFTADGNIEFGYQVINDEMRFFVKDTGKGIFKDQENKIFEPFYTSADSSEGLGAGLGLTVAKGLTTLLKGRMWLHSEEGQGSVFYLAIPFITHKEDMRKMIENAEDSYQHAQQQPVTILIVEDDQSHALFLNEVLKSPEYEGWGLDIQFVTNGKEAVEFCSNNPVDLILMDIKLPEMDGLTACRKIKLANPRIPVIAQTACATSADKDAIFAAGYNDYLAKPLSLDLIFQKLKKHLLIRRDSKAYYEN